MGLFGKNLNYLLVYHSVGVICRNMKLFKRIQRKLRRFLRGKDKKYVESGRLGGLKSGEARLLRKIEREIEQTVLGAYPEVELFSKVLNEFGVRMEPIRLLEVYLKLRKRIDFENLINYGADRGMDVEK